MWEIRLHSEVETWFLRLCTEDPESADLVSEAVDLLGERGPTLGRLKGSSYHNMKELRPGSSGSTELRMIFAFDPAREAIFLVAGDKAGRWREWYENAIPLADTRFAEHLKALE
ncbi:type II toxin-antitoxin system RelE/ParE family toxin, partial [Actinoplanes campanulatus]